MRLVRGETGTGPSLGSGGSNPNQTPLRENEMGATIASKPAAVNLSVIVNYHGSKTELHGLWRLAENYGAMLKLRDAYCNTLVCHPGSVTIVNIPELADVHVQALLALKDSPVTGVDVSDVQVRVWLLRNGMAVRPDVKRKDHCKLTELGAIVADSIGRW